jgi:hypothetical protein
MAVRGDDSSVVYDTGGHAVSRIGNAEVHHVHHDDESQQEGSQEGAHEGPQRGDPSNAQNGGGRKSGSESSSESGSDSGSDSGSASGSQRSVSSLEYGGEGDSGGDTGDTGGTRNGGGNDHMHIGEGARERARPTGGGRREDAEPWSADTDMELPALPPPSRQGSSHGPASGSGGEGEGGGDGGDGGDSIGGSGGMKDEWGQWGPASIRLRPPTPPWTPITGRKDDEKGGYEGYEEGGGDAKDGEVESRSGALGGEPNSGVDTVKRRLLLPAGPSPVDAEGSATQVHAGGSGSSGGSGGNSTSTQRTRPARAARPGSAAPSKFAKKGALSGASAAGAASGAGGVSAASAASGGRLLGAMHESSVEMGSPVFLTSLARHNHDPNREAGSARRPRPGLVVNTSPPVSSGDGNLSAFAAHVAATRGAGAGAGEGAGAGAGGGHDGHEDGGDTIIYQTGGGGGGAAALGVSAVSVLSAIEDSTPLSPLHSQKLVQRLQQQREEQGGGLGSLGGSGGSGGSGSLGGSGGSGAGSGISGSIGSRSAGSGSGGGGGRSLGGGSGGRIDAAPPSPQGHQELGRNGRIMLQRSLSTESTDDNSPRGGRGEQRQMRWRSGPLLGEGAFSKV